MRKGRWRRKGNWKSETLWPLLSNIFNTFLGTEPFQDDADFVPGEMVLTHGAANIADQLFGTHPRGRSGGVSAGPLSPWVTMTQTVPLR